MRWKLWALLAAVFTFAVLATSAWAGHVHTVGEWYHGLGDGANNNAYVHPFNDNTANHDHCNEVRLYRSGAGERWRFRQCWRHTHAYWDTSPYAECRYFSSHESTSVQHPLNLNYHFHHNDCR